MIPTNSPVCQHIEHFLHIFCIPLYRHTEWIEAMVSRHAPVDHNYAKKLTALFSGGILLRRIAFHRASRLFVQITGTEGVLS